MARNLNGYDYTSVPIKGPTNLIADGISRSITVHTAQNTFEVNTPIAQVEALTNDTYVSRVGSMFCVHDTRMDKLDYSKCKNFSAVMDNLGMTDIITHTKF